MLRWAFFAAECPLKTVDSEDDNLNRNNAAPHKEPLSKAEPSAETLPHTDRKQHFR